MNPYFPLSDVQIEQVSLTRKVDNPSYENSWMAINESEFYLDVAQIATFFACNGNYIEFTPFDGAALASVELYLNGSVYGAILHQRKILPLHGSSFVYKNSGIMICGDSGAGKSSLTVSFCDNGADFLTDDVSPVILEQGVPHVISKSDRVKLWDDSLRQLQKENNRLSQIRPQDKKYYVSVSNSKYLQYPLKIIFIIETSDLNNVEFEPVKGTASFPAIHDQIYRLYYLHAMPETLHSYFSEVASISNHCILVKVKRPINIPIDSMKTELEKYISSLSDT